MAAIPVIAVMPAVRSFSWNTPIKPAQPGVKEQVIDMAMNNRGIRDTARVLKVATSTVMTTLKIYTPET
ncbi:transposase [Xenorhabdus budapestensis]|uniref:Transposase n=1 Tax=Xenorhabdus budapestensis TaxID=290110 RepID=A0A2D0J392_XENBU|nr:transposase [Xenorhabdus budapestensis]